MAGRTIPITFHRRDEQFIEGMKQNHDIPYAETVRIALRLYRRVVTSFDDGYVDMVMQSSDERDRRYFGDLAEFMPLESKRKE